MKTKRAHSRKKSDAEWRKLPSAVTNGQLEDLSNRMIFFERSEPSKKGREAYRNALHALMEVWFLGGLE